MRKFLYIKIGGSILNKPCGLRSGWISLMHHSPSPKKRFPIMRKTTVLPTVMPDCHLDHTAIPNMPQKNSLGAFLNSSKVP